jgi:hypothetical protein
LSAANFFGNGGQRNCFFLGDAPSYKNGIGTRPDFVALIAAAGKFSFTITVAFLSNLSLGPGRFTDKNHNQQNRYGQTKSINTPPQSFMKMPLSLLA